ncbi:MAG: hypothetical protein JO114_18700 [Planctomycetaceae bacterium]|nr:hypothetical protein [Planctomycetaceae bacterium]MBV8310565.1 hypothetical protein [Planctomycetaceae bacterium]
MSRIPEVMFGAWLLLGLVSGVSAQAVVNYPPATGNMVDVPPSYPAPEAFGGQYVETFPSFAESFDSSSAYAVQPGVPYATQTRPATAVRVRGRNLRATRTYSQAPAPYATQLPQGQLYWPDSYLTPNYVPLNRYQSYGSGYGRGPYGSNFYGGYYKGFLLGY